MLVIAFEAPILFTIILWEPTFRALVHFPHFIRAQLLLLPSIFNLLSALLMLVYGRLIFLIIARWILLCTTVRDSAVCSNGGRDLGCGGRLLLLGGVLMSLVPLVVVLFVFGLLENVFVPDLHEHHVDGFVFSSTARTFVAWDILEVQSVYRLTIVALPTFAPLKLLLLIFFLTFALTSWWLLYQWLVLRWDLHEKLLYVIEELVNIEVAFAREMQLGDW